MSDEESALSEALRAVPESKERIAQELRQMAEGEGEYQRFLYISPWIKNVWRAAAELLEDNSVLH